MAAWNSYLQRLTQHECLTGQWIESVVMSARANCQPRERAPDSVSLRVLTWSALLSC